MAATPYEYHNSIEEYFPMSEPVKGRKKFSKKTAGASGIMTTVSAGIIAAAVTLLLLFCRTTGVGTTSASFRTTVCNANDSTQIHYYVIPYETVSQNMEMDGLLQGKNTGTDTENLFMRNAVASGPVSSGTDSIEVEGLVSDTRYLIAFFDTNPDSPRLLNTLEFSTRGPNSDGKPPVPEEIIPVETSPAPPREETPAPSETVSETIPETVPETVPETTEETVPETVPQPTTAPPPTPVYTPPPKETMPPVAAQPPSVVIDPPYVILVPTPPPDKEELPPPDKEEIPPGTDVPPDVAS